MFSGAVGVANDWTLLMNTRSGWVRGSLLVALIVGLPAVPEADAKGGRGGHGGGHGGHPPRVSAAHRAFKAPSYKAPRTPHAMAPAHTNAARAGAQAHIAHPGASHATASATHRAATANAGLATAGVANRSTTTGANQAVAHRAATGNVNPAATSAVIAPRAATTNPYAYTYGSGSGARHYRAYGYGRGHRNRYYGGGYGYGRSQGNNRAIVSRLRSVHASLARIDHDYQGHRIRAMHSISMAIRQLSHRSMVYGGSGFASGMGGNRLMGNRQGGLGAGGRRGQPLSQAQSDARMGQSLRILQGVNMQLSSQGANTSGHARARGHIQGAIRELNVALSIR